MSASLIAMRLAQGGCPAQEDCAGCGDRCSSEIPGVSLARQTKGGADEGWGDLMGAWVAVAAGGAIGSVARFWLTGVMTALTGPRFPWGTLLINVLGSLVIGLVAGLTLVPGRLGMHANIRIFVMTGVCGGFTTFSAFSLQTLELMQAGEVIPALGYVVASVVLCVVATYGGWLLGRV